MYGFLLVFAVRMVASSAGAVSGDCGELWLTEVHPDPGYHPDKIAEFVEIYNPTRTAQLVKGWALVVNKRTYLLPSYTLQSEEVAVVSRAVWEGQRTQIVLHRLRLPNREAVVRMVDPCGRERQVLRWGKPSRLRARRGRSIELTYRGKRTRWQHAKPKHRWLRDRASPGVIPPRLTRHLAPKGTRIRPAVSKPIDSKRTVRPTDGSHTEGRNHRRLPLGTMRE